MSWDVVLGTVGSTVVRAPLEEWGGWPMARVLGEWAKEEHIRPATRPDAVGGGHGEPIIHRAHFDEPVGIDVTLRVTTAGRELEIEIPDGLELCDAIEEHRLWNLIDIALEASAATHASIGDGAAEISSEPQSGAQWRRELSRQIGLVVPRYVTQELGADAAPYRELQRSRLVVMLR